MARSNLAEASSGGEFAVVRGERPVPRISIAAFCSTPEMLDVAQRVGADRRLANAHVSIYSGGVAEAVQQFAHQPAPDLVLLETSREGAELLADLDQLATVCEETTKAVVIGRANDVALYRELMRRGISEYLLAPVDPLKVMEAISGLYVAPDAKPIGRVIVFTGARGGAGSSTLAHNVGWMLAQTLKAHTAIIDLDFAFGTAALNFNQEPAQGAADALIEPDRIDDVLLERLFVKHGEHLSLLTSPAALHHDYEFGADAFQKLIERARSMTPFVVVDLPHGWNSSARHLLHIADEVVIVATPELSSLRNCKNLLQTVQSRRVNDAPAKVVLNQVGLPKRPEISLKDFTATLGQAPDLVIPFDAQLFGKAANNGQMLPEVQPKSRISDGIGQFARSVAGRHARSAPAKAGLLSLPFLKLKTA